MLIFWKSSRTHTKQNIVKFREIWCRQDGRALAMNFNSWVQRSWTSKHSNQLVRIKKLPKIYGFKWTHYYEGLVTGNPVCNLKTYRSELQGHRSWVRAHSLFCLTFIEKRNLPTHVLFPVLVLPIHFEEALYAPELQLVMNISVQLCFGVRFEPA